MNALSLQRTGPARRYNRSRCGCLTCKRRKVKCDEQRPRCSHCERLNLECKWRPLHASALAKQRQDINGESGVASLSHQLDLSPSTDPSPTATGLRTLQAMDEVFDYASFMWDPGSSLWQQESPNMATSLAMPTNTMEFSSSTTGHADSRIMDTFRDAEAIQDNGDKAVDQNAFTSSEKLMEFFAKSATPPILAGVESQKKWLSIRQSLVAMSKSSRVLRCAILAFSNTLLCRSNLSWAFDDQSHYQEAAVEVEAQDHDDSLTGHSLARECLLAALFFLSYVGIIESRLDTAHRYLKQAYTIFQKGDKASFSHVEKQVLLWIRLLDARAVSAGGEGLFLSQDDEMGLVEASPASFDAETDEGSRREDASCDDIEDVLFQVLYQPGIVFFQKVQSFMGRISKIDPWHRSRGTVEDEIEVMNIGASIAADLRTLYDQRPPLMDYAVAGKLSEPHISANLAFTITRAFRTYLSNYYASKVHLHRVAYKHLPLTNEAIDALGQIRKLAHQISSDLAPEDSLPVNMLWPLLMLGVEEQDPEEKAWIRAQIVRMEGVAGNARITAQVLEEVQARQEASKARADIRSVMHAVFNSCFAIL
ncbi:Zn2Cys6 transcriptional regulator [Trichoderma parareesei]|uniref:Zn2Cys6 transcriptional regulator n=1 Tax=Trichoderma parareesei TaxID=858221 RepID=A0A2H2ZIV9_TRIPA|nr:Zn2Cys6 transcriptional regulator [Trichoderma parareesei]